MKKLIPLALTASMLAACATNNQGQPVMWWQDGGMNWGHCEHCWGPVTPLSERSFGALRGAHHEVFEHNDVVGNGYWYNAPADGAVMNDKGAKKHHHHWDKKAKSDAKADKKASAKTSK